MRIATLIATFLSFAARPIGSQTVDPKELLHPADAWLTYHGDYTGRRHSSLTQITPGNVGRLKEVWRFQASQALKASPIVANGVIYITAPDNL